MTANIYQQDLDFLAEAKRSFEKHPRYETHRNDENTHIALRYGEDRDCIMIYKLGEKVMFANNIMDAAPELTVKVNHENSDEFEEGDVLMNITSDRLALFIKKFPNDIEVQIRRGVTEFWTNDCVVLYAKKREEIK